MQQTGAVPCKHVDKLMLSYNVCCSELCTQCGIFKEEIFVIIKYSRNFPSQMVEIALIRNVSFSFLYRVMLYLLLRSIRSINRVVIYRRVQKLYAD